MSNGTTTRSTTSTLKDVEQFLYRQADILDERRWEEWLGLFTDDGIYWMPASADQETGEGQPNIFGKTTILWICAFGVWSIRMLTPRRLATGQVTWFPT